jgi:O-acetyl-ADP-ribose deacetylase (regulator of RNase III)
MSVWSGGRVVIVQADITSLEVDAVVNAANRGLLGGGGVDGAIHRRAGPGLLNACRKLGGCQTGSAKATGGFGLRAQWVFHAVGPVWSGGTSQEDELLEGCYQKSLELAVEFGAGSLAFPAISTGVYGFPIESATTIAMDTVAEFLNERNMPEKVIFCCYSGNDLEVYERLAEKLL